MQIQSNGKVRRTAPEWRKILSRHASSGLSIGAFCKRESLTTASFHRWRARLASQPKSVLEKSSVDVSFLAGMLIDKVVYHLPLYRQHQRLRPAAFAWLAPR